MGKTGPSPYDCVRFGDYIRVPAGLADLTRKWGSSLRRLPHFGQPLGQGRSRACVRAVSRSPCAPLPARRNGQRTSVFGAPILAGLQCEGLGRLAPGSCGHGLPDVRLEIELVGADGAATTGDAAIGRCRPRQTGVFRRSTAWARRRAPRSMASYRIRSPISERERGGSAPFEPASRSVARADRHSTERQPVQDHRRHIHLCTEDIGLVPPNRAQVRYGPYLVGHLDRSRVEREHVAIVGDNENARIVCRSDARQFTALDGEWPRSVRAMLLTYAGGRFATVRIRFPKDRRDGSGNWQERP